MQEPTNTSEVKVTDSSDWKEFERINAEFVRVFSAKSVAVADGLDEAYYDYMVRETLVTVHLQHYLGISIFLRSPQNASFEDREVLSQIRAHYQK
jgi:hypothetical protein